MSDTKTPRFINAKRRGFLQGAAVAGGAVAGGVAAASETLTPEAAPELPVVESKGYKRNEYVSRYYARARF